MTETYEYDEATSLRQSIDRIRGEWQQLYDASTSGRRAYMTRVKKYYAKLLANDPQAVIELLAMHEHRIDAMTKDGVAADD